MGPTPLHLADRYRLYEQIGSGRAGTVWLAWDETLARLVAVKVLRSSQADDPVFCTRFLEQVRKAARLSHPSIVAVHDFGEAPVPDGGPLPFAVMELLEGRTLAARLARGPLPWREAVRICGQVAAALAHAHAAGTAHHDLKPTNVFLTPAGAVVLDFGTGKLFGGPVADPAAEDVRALGLLLTATLTGQWDAKARLPSQVPYEVAAVHVRCLLPDPGARPSSAQVAEVLAGAADPRRPAVPVGTGAVPPMVRRMVRPRARGHIAVLLSALLAMAIVMLVFGGGSSGRGPMTHAPNLTNAPTTVFYRETVSASPSPAPSPGTGRPTPAPDEPTPAKTPREAVPSPRPSEPRADPVEVLSRAQRSVDEGVAAGEIRSDVGLDLNNVLGNLRRELESGRQVDLGPRLAEIRNKITTRVRENGLTQGRADRLNAILSEIPGPGRAA